MSHPLFSILIANYNNGHFFKDCYDSLIAQTYQNFEVVILDDCSTDNSVEVIKSIIGEDKRFKLFQNEENKKVGYTKRRLVELASSEICGFLDPDDALEPQTLESILNHHNNNIEVGLVYSNFIICNEKLEKQNVHHATQITALDEHYLNFKGEISHFATFKKSIYNKTTGIDTFLKIAEDKDWYMKMCEVAPVLYIDEDLYLYRIHNGGISTNKNAEKAYFWHWVALIKMAERRNVNIEELFIDNFVNRRDYDNISTKLELLKKSRLLKLLYKLGLFKGYKYL
ncbi:glycosyltransferase [Empedobacter sp. GD03797]|uniref:glycosyltransferase family 2 protein n=1 Tax=Empedobacter sp. GD03797 TaxID=2975382 RepID=UPI00244C8602|nr:glycosyltransferase [Empedobacter sp. GD03797]MDH1881985.1 glycosyltransferase [Empedobacter sp. GD03797]